MIDQSVADVMTREVRTLTPETTACAVATLFADHSIGSAVVVDDAGDPVGIVTESDVMRQVADGADISAVRVDSFMTTPLITVTTTEDIHRAATVMKENSIRRLPVVDDGDLVGILTTTDLTHYLPRLRNTILRDRSELAGH
jgi:CBS domain-containing protein